MVKARYFQDELTYLRALGKVYTADKPMLQRVLNEPGADPDVERLFEGFALLTSRLRQRLDDSFPEISHPIPHRLWPGFLRPLPSVAMVEYTLSGGAFDERKIAPRGATLRILSQNGVTHEFETASECSVYPLQITGVESGGAVDRAHIRIKLSTLGQAVLTGIGLTDLRIWLDGPWADILYQWNFHSLTSLSLTDAYGHVVSLPLSVLSAGGFLPSDALFPESDPLYDGHRLLQEYFLFPDKFRCLDLSGLRPYVARLEGSKCTLEFGYNRPLPEKMGKVENAIHLFRTPVVNLSSVSAHLEPLAEQDHTAFKLSTVLGKGKEIFSIDRVGVWNAPQGASATRAYSYPRYDASHALSSDDNDVFYQEEITPTSSGGAYDHSIHFLSRHGQPRAPNSAVEVFVRCFAHGLENEIVTGTPCSQMHGSQSFVAAEVKKTPTKVLYPRHTVDEWAQISNLQFNFLSLENSKALLSIIKLYDYRAASDREAASILQHRLSGVLTVKTVPADRMMQGRVSRGLETVVHIKESAFENEGDAYLFLTILAEFLRFYASTTSFHHLRAHGQENGRHWDWKVRTGRKALL